MIAAGGLQLAAGLQWHGVVGKWVFSLGYQLHV